MQKTPLRFPKTEAPTASLTIAEFEAQARDWLFDCEFRQHSSRTIDRRKIVIEKLLWFLRQQNHTQCGKSELRQFLAYMGRGHLEPGGRWGNPQLTRPVRPRTVHTYYGHLLTFFRWLVKEEVLDVSPMERIEAPIFRVDQVQPFTQEQVSAPGQTHYKRATGVCSI